jgi:predicted transcriptional regulator
MKEVIASSSAINETSNETGKTTVRITDLEAAWFLIQLGQLQQLRLFMEHEVTVSQVSRELGLDFNRAYSFVKRLLRLKLIKISRLEKRNGRPIRHYRSVADHFFVPFTLLSLEHALQAMSFELQQTMLRNIAKTELQGLDRNAGLQATMDASGVMHCTLMKGPDEPMPEWTELQSASILCWQPLTLDFVAAKNLQKELDEVLSRYSDQTGSQKYLLHVGLCALNDNDQRQDQLLPFHAFKGL